ncbi:uncharacterized protein LOC125043525 [Penaeus chinensis]|uniref:uncharacterized protein LOC125043525 n=1 Tax=Penaeus chinensis TaxID=139456 RepID=UPI001FB6C402|nr:uncharacterized protein LOC125043525 [Penaeus chinensis]
MPTFPPTGRCLIRWLLLAAMVSAASTEILYAETANITFGEWLVQQQPNQILEEVIIRGRHCFCRRAVLPPSEPDTSSFEMILGGGIFGGPGSKSSFDYLFIPQGQ